jgi:adenosylcobinamide kinase / adenosylcobinamide-phosphate guanylyltransferase
MFVFLVGGARSGKSALAVRLAARHAASGLAVSYVATSPRIEGDHDLAARIEAHRHERPPSWATIEEEHDLVGVLERSAEACVVVDCLTLWVNNLVWRGDDDDTIEQHSRRAAAAAASRRSPTIVISNEVGLGIHPAADVGRRYRDLLGRVNQHWTAAAHRSLFCVAGRALALTEPEALL